MGMQMSRKKELSRFAYVVKEVDAGEEDGL